MSSKPTGPRPGQVRIIAGRWRGRKLAVPDVDGLRPTGDRMRETLFNWLQPHLAGARCLDLFAGSGALGFEALSRYAASVVFVESDARACKGLAQSARLLDVHLADDLSTTAPARSEDGPIAQLYTGQAVHVVNSWQEGGHAPRFDLVFIDPPFSLGCQWSMLELLSASLLQKQALIYVESPDDLPVPDNLPSGCEIIREKCFGNVIAYLVRFSSTA